MCHTFWDLLACPYLGCGCPLALPPEATCHASCFPALLTLRHLMGQWVPPWKSSGGQGAVNTPHRAWLGLGTSVRSEWREDHGRKPAAEQNPRRPGRWFIGADTGMNYKSGLSFLEKLYPAGHHQTKYCAITQTWPTVSPVGVLNAGLCNEFLSCSPTQLADFKVHISTTELWHLPRQEPELWFASLVAQPPVNSLHLAHLHRVVIGTVASLKTTVLASLVWPCLEAVGTAHVLLRERTCEWAQGGWL